MSDVTKNDLRALENKMADLDSKLNTILKFVKDIQARVATIEAKQK
jgi:hypothetical protein